MTETSPFVNIDEFLSLNKYEVDEANAHIELVEDPDDAEFDKLIKVCPAALYKRDEDGRKTFDYAGCLECGTCRIVCGNGRIRSRRWESNIATDSTQREKTRSKNLSRRRRGFSPSALPFARTSSGIHCIHHHEA